MLTNPLPQMLAACTLGTEGMVHGDGSHVKDAKSPNVHAAVKLLAVYPSAQFTVHDAESAILTTPLPQMPAASETIAGAGGGVAFDAADPIFDGCNSIVAHKYSVVG